MEETASGRRLTLYYIFLAVVVAAVAAIVFAAGEDEQAQPSIAGGYDLQGPNACFGDPPAPAPGEPLPPTAPPQSQVSGPSFDVKQSGQFVNLSNTQGTLGGKLRLEESSSASGARPLSGDVELREREDAGLRRHGHAWRQGRDRRCPRG